MDLLSQLVETSACKQRSDEADQEETDIAAATTRLDKEEGLKMAEANVNIEKADVVCKKEEPNLENCDSLKFGIVESFMLKVLFFSLIFRNLLIAGRG